MSNFGLYSKYYDLLYQEKDYISEVEYIDDLINQHLHNATTILDLGCGTGIHATELVVKGYSVTGVDISQTMLEAANKRKAELLPPISNKLEFYQGDARTFRIDQTYDVVISLFHVFSYQTSTADLQSAFETAAMHLRPGGILIFDYWYGPAVLTQRPDVKVKRLENDSCTVLRIAEPVLHNNNNVVDVNYLLFIDSKQHKNSERITEKHKMRYLFLPEIEMLASNNFKIIKHLGWMSFSSPDLDSWAGVSILERK